jgi:hydroxymethylpyrimidine pyrophosphatase-like HAD family hydrolase
MTSPCFPADPTPSQWTNALPKAKSVANYATPSNDDEGVYHGLKQLISEGLL